MKYVIFTVLIILIAIVCIYLFNNQAPSEQLDNQPCEPEYVFRPTTIKNYICHETDQPDVYNCLMNNKKVCIKFY